MFSTCHKAPIPRKIAYERLISSQNASYTAVIDLLLDVIPVKNILFASEMIGAVRGIDPHSGHYYDDTKRYIDGNKALNDAQKKMIFEDNARTLFSRLTL